MVDLETFGTDTNSMIVSIGAVFFDLNTGAIGDEFYTNIRSSSCAEYGLTANGSSIEFWLRQPDEARLALLENPLPVALTKGLHQFTEFYGPEVGKNNIWGNGSVFDNMVLKNAYKAVKKPLPWSYRNDRDVRTLVELGKQSGFDYHKIEREGVYHNALDDAKHQVKFCSIIYKYIKENKW